MEKDEVYVCLENGKIYTLLYEEEGGPIVVDNLGNPIDGNEIAQLVGDVHLVKYVDFLQMANVLREI